MNYATTLLVFLLINFGGLAIGAIWTNPGTSSQWYRSLTQPPWEPPGFVYGLAWTIIAITFSIMMSHFWVNKDFGPLAVFPIALLLNIMWSPVFFGLRSIWGGVAVLLALAAVIYYMTDFARINYGWKIAWLGLPYFLWLMTATSISMFLAIKNEY